MFYIYIYLFYYYIALFLSLFILLIYVKFNTLHSFLSVLYIQLPILYLGRKQVMIRNRTQ